MAFDDVHLKYKEAECSMLSLVVVFEFMISKLNPFAGVTVERPLLSSEEFYS